MKCRGLWTSPLDKSYDQASVMFHLANLEDGVKTGFRDDSHHTSVRWVTTHNHAIITEVVPQQENLMLLQIISR